MTTSADFENPFLYPFHRPIVPFHLDSPFGALRNAVTLRRFFKKHEREGLRHGSDSEVVLQMHRPGDGRDGVLCHIQYYRWHLRRPSPS